MSNSNASIARDIPLGVVAFRDHSGALALASETEGICIRILGTSIDMLPFEGTAGELAEELGAAELDDPGAVTVPVDMMVALLRANGFEVTR